MIWPLFRFLGRNLSYFFIVFFGKFKTSKGYSEINWPFEEVLGKDVDCAIGEFNTDAVVNLNLNDLAKTDGIVSYFGHYLWQLSVILMSWLEYRADLNLMSTDNKKEILPAFLKFLDITRYFGFLIRKLTDYWKQ